MTSIESYDLGWMVIDTIHAAHFYRTNSQSKVALSHCGVMLPKAALRAYKGANRCGYCQAIQNIKDEARKDVSTPDFDPGGYARIRQSLARGHSDEHKEK